MSSARGGAGVGCQPFFFLFSPVQQTTSGIGHRVKYFFFGLATNALNVRNNNNNNKTTTTGHVISEQIFNNLDVVDDALPCRKSASNSANCTHLMELSTPSASCEESSSMYGHTLARVCNATIRIIIVVCFLHINRSGLNNHTQ